MTIHIPGLKQEPIVYLMLLLVGGITLYNVFVNHTPIDSVLTEDYLTYVITVASGIIARFSVFSPKSVNAKVEIALAQASADRTRAAEIEGIA